MKFKLPFILLIASALLSGCAAKQEISRFNGDIPSMICIAKHEAVKEGVLIALQDGLKKHGINSSVIQATYTEKHGQLTPNVDSENLNQCGAILFYTARWSWDLATYMSFANIWVTDPEMSKNVAQATYVSRHGLDKFINARKKILELVDSMFES